MKGSEKVGMFRGSQMPFLAFKGLSGSSQRVNTTMSLVNKTDASLCF